MGLSIPQMALMSRLLDEALPLVGEGGLAGALDAGARSDLDRIGSGPRPGEIVGPYRVIRLLGEGGMAEVWLAERADGAFKRDVALKLPVLLRLREDLASRFARERDILAALEHPNIARLYDAGVSSNGLPYLAMEYVAGEPLTDWCDAHQLAIRERVRLFLQVLDAVQYAHGQRVIHRDIKPSNILVTDSGQVRLLDFGVAKLLAREEEQSDLTQRYGRVLTPDYASPELVRGEQLGAAGDVYALGVVLYELLSGNRPYHLQAGASVAQLEHAIAAVEVERPSTRVAAGAGGKRGTTERKLARRLRGDLDAIVLKALAKAPASRYDSAAAFADDLQRSLSVEPVEARPDRVCDRTAGRGAWLRSHPLARRRTARGDGHGHLRSRRNRRRTAGEVDRRSAVHRPEREEGPGVLLRRALRGADRPPRAQRGSEGHCAHLVVPVQGQEPGRALDRSHARRDARAGRQRSQGRAAATHHRTAGSRFRRRATVVADLRSQLRRHFQGPGRDLREGFPGPASGLAERPRGRRSRARCSGVQSPSGRKVLRGTQYAARRREGH